MNAISVCICGENVDLSSIIFQFVISVNFFNEKLFIFLSAGNNFEETS